MQDSQVRIGGARMVLSGIVSALLISLAIAMLTSGSHLVFLIVSAFSGWLAWTAYKIAVQSFSDHLLRIGAAWGICVLIFVAITVGGSTADPERMASSEPLQANTQAITSTEATLAKEGIAAAESDKANAAVLTYLDNLDEEKTRVRGGKAIATSELADDNGVKTQTDFISFLAEPYFKIEGMKFTSQQQKRRASYAAWLANVQAVRFPQLRRAYAKQIAQIGWRSDLYAQTAGAANDTLLVTGADLAANANKEDLKDALMPGLRMMRFKRVAMRWYKGGGQTYWDISTPADRDVQILGDDGKWGKPSGSGQ